MPAPRAASKPAVKAEVEPQEAKPEETKGPQGIHEKILHIQKHIEVQKLGFHEKNNNNYMRDEDVVTEVAKYINQLGIITTLRDRRGTHTPQFDQNGRYKPSVFIEATFVFFDVETGQEWTIEVSGEGASTGGSDATRIAHTMIHKIAYIETFKIRETNDSYDSDSIKTQIPDAEPLPAEKSEAEKKTALSIAELTEQVNDFVNKKGVPGPTVAVEGNKIAGEGIAQADWKNDPRVMEKLVERLQKIVDTGEVS